MKATNGEFHQHLRERYISEIENYNFSSLDYGFGCKGSGFIINGRREENG